MMSSIMMDFMVLDMWDVRLVYNYMAVILYLCFLYIGVTFAFFQRDFSHFYAVFKDLTQWGGER